MLKVLNVLLIVPMFIIGMNLPVLEPETSFTMADALGITTTATKAPATSFRMFPDKLSFAVLDRHTRLATRQEGQAVSVQSVSQGDGAFPRIIVLRSDGSVIQARIDPAARQTIIEAGLPGALQPVATLGYYVSRMDEREGVIAWTGPGSVYRGTLSGAGLSENSVVSVEMPEQPVLRVLGPDSAILLDRTSAKFSLIDFAGKTARSSELRSPELTRGLRPDATPPPGGTRLLVLDAAAGQDAFYVLLATMFVKEGARLLKLDLAGNVVKAWACKIPEDFVPKHLQTAARYIAIADGTGSGFTFEAP